jgi:1,4-dihydroxy-2-naphthoyl-CoA synthase
MGPAAFQLGIEMIFMKYTSATFQEEGRVNVIALRRPESGNAFNRKVAAELTESGEAWVRAGNQARISPWSSFRCPCPINTEHDT